MLEPELAVARDNIIQEQEAKSQLAPISGGVIIFFFGVINAMKFPKVKPVPRKLTPQQIAIYGEEGSFDKLGKGVVSIVVGSALVAVGASLNLAKSSEASPKEKLFRTLNQIEMELFELRKELNIDPN